MLLHWRPLSTHIVINKVVFSVSLLVSASLLVLTVYLNQHDWIQRAEVALNTLPKQGEASGCVLYN